MTPAATARRAADDAQHAVGGARHRHGIAGVDRASVTGEHRQVVLGRRGRVEVVAERNLTIVSGGATDILGERVGSRTTDSVGHDDGVGDVVRRSGWSWRIANQRPSRARREVGVGDVVGVVGAVCAAVGAGEVLIVVAWRNDIDVDRRRGTFRSTDGPAPTQGSATTHRLKMWAAPQPGTGGLVEVGGTSTGQRPRIA